MKFRSLPASRRVALALAVLASGIVAGCRSRPPGLMPGGAAADSTPPALAEALANFGAGVLRAGLGETNAALDNLRQAEALAPDNVRVSFQLAMQYLGRGQADQALEAIAAAVARNPDSPDACLLQARIAQEAQRPEVVRQALERAIALDPRRAASHVYLAVYYGERRDTEQAITVLEDALPQVDEPLQLLRILGDLYAMSMLQPDGVSDDQRERYLRRAIECYRQAALHPPDEFRDDYQIKLGDLYLSDEQYAPAAEIFAELADRQPDNLTLWKRLAMSLNGAGRKQEAAAAWKRVAALAPGDPQAQAALGQPPDDVAARKMAITAYRLAIHDEPENPRHYETLALLLADAAVPEAIEVVEDGLRRIPGDLKLKDLLARLYLRAKRASDAWEIYRELQGRLEAGAAPELLTDGFWMGYAAAAQQIGQTNEAAALYEKALTGNPRQVDAFLRLAFLHAARGATREADAVMRRAADALPESAEVRYFAGIMASQHGDYARAREAFARAGELAAASGHAEKILNADYYFYYGAASERGKDFTRAAELFRQALQLDPDHADAANYLAYMWAEQGINLDQALLHARHAVELQPENGAYLDTLGWVYFKMGRLNEAADEVYNSLQADPDSSTVMEHYGDILEGQGDLSAARDWWLKSWHANPGSPDLQRKLERSGGVPAAPPNASEPSAQ